MNKKELAEYIENKIEKNILENTILFYGEEKDLFKEDILKFAEKILCVNLFNLDENKAVPDLKISENFWNDEKKQIKISEVKEFFSDVKFKATKDKKIYILDDANMLNINAQNAILKIIEEPNPGTYIFLLANQIDTILNTIKSRCTKIYLKEKKIAEDSSIENINDEKTKEIKNIFLDAVNLNKIKYIDKYNKIIDVKKIDEIIENLEKIYEYSLFKNKEVSKAYYIILDIKKKKSYNLNPNILKYELIFGIYNTINLKSESLNIEKSYMKKEEKYIKKDLNNLNKLIYS